MQVHASCAALRGDGVLLLGSPGSGKSDLLLRLLDHGFDLVADDQVILEQGVARAAPALRGLIEVRGLGIIRLPCVAGARAVLAVEMGRGDRMPAPESRYGVPLIRIDPAQASAPSRIRVALGCIRRETELVAGAFA